MKTMKFSGREIAVLRAIDFATGTLGSEVLAKTRIEDQEALDIVNSLLGAGYIETAPPQNDPVDMAAFYEMQFEVNPAYAHDLKKSLVR